jgi:nucleoside-diphosphate-sugar epimerase
MINRLQFKDKKVLISGGLGFIGSNLAIELVNIGAFVTIVDSLIPEYGGNFWNIEPVKNQVKVNISDVRDPHSMQYLVQNQDYFFNLAGQTSHLDSMVNPFPDLEINARAQLSILEACRKHNPTVKIVFASTRQIYGKPQYLPVDENHPLNPADVNGINKLSGEWYHIIYHRVHGISSSILRLTNTYGPRMRIKDARQTFLGIWIKNLLEEKPISIYGDGQQIRDYNYVDDVVEALLTVALKDLPAGTIFNLGDNNPRSLRETADLMIEINRKGSYQLVPFPEKLKYIDIGDFYGDFSKIQNETGWFPRTSIYDGLNSTISYFRQNLEKYR